MDADADLSFTCTFRDIGHVLLPFRGIQHVALCERSSQDLALFAAVGPRLSKNGKNGNECLVVVVVVQNLTIEGS